MVDCTVLVKYLKFHLVNIQEHFNMQSIAQNIDKNRFMWEIRWNCMVELKRTQYPWN